MAMKPASAVFSDSQGANDALAQLRTSNLPLDAIQLPIVDAGANQASVKNILERNGGR